MSQVHRFSRDELAAQPWKNGGGVTREIASWPPGSTVDNFDWRVSIAHIARSGPFSAFNGVDRVITLLEGAGVVLHSADGAIHHRLSQPLMPFAFPGEVPLQADLIGPDCHDFNVMTRRAVCSASVQVLNQYTELPPSFQGLLLATVGEWQANGETLLAHQGLWWQGVALGWTLSPSTTGAALMAVSIQSLP